MYINLNRLLKGVNEDNNDDFEERHKLVFSVLDENESGEITLDELGKFLRELFKEQIKELQSIQRNRNKE